jgi:hypothetical protein
MRQHCLMFRCPGMNSLSVSRSPSHPPPCYLYLFLPLSPFSPPSPWVVVYPNVLFSPGFCPRWGPPSTE